MLNPLDLIYIDKLKDKDSSIDRLFDWMDNRLSAGEFDKVDNYLATVDITLQSSVNLVGMLCTTHLAQSKLKNFEKFARDVSDWFVKTRGKREAKELMRGFWRE